jgi:hypothetical protein
MQGGVAEGSAAEMAQGRGLCRGQGRWAWSAAGLLLTGMGVGKRSLSGVPPRVRRTWTHAAPNAESRTGPQGATVQDCCQVGRAGKGSSARPMSFITVLTHLGRCIDFTWAVGFEVRGEWRRGTPWYSSIEASRQYPRCPPPDSGRTCASRRNTRHASVPASEPIKARACSRIQTDGRVAGDAGRP